MSSSPVVFRHPDPGRDLAGDLALAGGFEAQRLVPCLPGEVWWGLDGSDVALWAPTGAFHPSG